MALGRQGERQADLMVGWAELPRSPGHAFYDRLQAVLVAAGFDGFAEQRCGPAPWEWRGKIRTSRGCAHGHPFHAEPCLDRGAIAEGRVQTLPVVEDLDVFEHGCLGLLTGAGPGLVDMLLLQ